MAGKVLLDAKKDRKFVSYVLSYIQPWLDKKMISNV